MKNLLTLVFIAAFIYACGGGASGPSEEMIAKGKETYTKLCVACHGQDGQLALNGAKKFPESTLTWEERIEVIANGRNLMTPFKGILKEDEIKAVAAYTMELSKKK